MPLYNFVMLGHSASDILCIFLVSLALDALWVLVLITGSSGDGTGGAGHGGSTGFGGSLEDL